MPRSKQTVTRSSGSKISARTARRVIREAAQRKRRRSQWTVALQEILTFRAGSRSTDILIPKQAFMNVVKDIAVDWRSDIRFQSAAIEALYYAVEAYVVTLFEDAMIAAVHDNRVTVMDRDLHFVLQIQQGRERNFVPIFP